MPNTKEIAIATSGVSLFAIVILAVIFAFGLFIVGFDRGHLFSLVIGEEAFSDLYIHELTHDLRHTAGFPCH